MKPETRGLWLGLLGVVIFSLTLPMTRLATGSANTPQLAGDFIALGRAAVAGLLGLALLLATRACIPQRHHWRLIGLTSAGAVFGFPLCTSFALRHVESVHASVILGVLPLATALMGAWMSRQRASLGFWVCALLGCALVVGFALINSGSQGLSLQWADLVLLAGMGCAALAYAAGGRLAGQLPAEQVICWALVLALPVTLPYAVWSWPAQGISAPAWGGFAYVAVFSMWLGFFPWYRGLALGGTVRVSQMQLVQPFLSMLWSVPLLGERLDAMTLAFGLSVLLVVALGRRMPVRVM